MNTGDARLSRVLAPSICSIDLALARTGLANGLFLDSCGGNPFSNRD